MNRVAIHQDASRRARSTKLPSTSGGVDHASAKRPKSMILSPQTTTTLPRIAALNTRRNTQSSTSCRETLGGVGGSRSSRSTVSAAFGMTTTAQLKPLPKATTIVTDNGSNQHDVFPNRSRSDRHAAYSSKNSVTSNGSRKDNMGRSVSSKTSQMHVSRTHSDVASMHYGEPSAGFMALLNASAIKIQNWYRRLALNRASRISKSTRQTTRSHDDGRDVPNTISTNTKLSLSISDESESSDAVMQRRKRMAEAAREEILREMNQGVLAMSACMDTSLVLPPVAPSAEPEAPSSIASHLKPDDTVQPRIDVAVVNTVDATVKAVDTSEFDYEDDFEPMCIESFGGVSNVQSRAASSAETAHVASPHVEEKQADIETSIVPGKDQTIVELQSNVVLNPKDQDQHDTKRENADSVKSTSALDVKIRPGSNKVKTTVGDAIGRKPPSMPSVSQAAYTQSRRTEYRIDIGKVPPMSSDSIPPTLPSFSSLHTKYTRRDGYSDDNYVRDDHEDIRSTTDMTHDPRMNTGMSHVYPNAPLQCQSMSGYASSPQTVPTNAHEDPTSRRVDRILEFLKTVEEEDRQVIKTPVSTRSNPMDVVADIFKDVQMTGKSSSSNLEANTVFEGVKAKLMSQQFEIEEKTRTLDLIKKELKKLKDMNREQSIEHQKSLKSQLTLQRKEYETIVKRHLSFIDKLLAEKEELSKRCEELTGEVKQLEKQFLDKTKALGEQHARDIKQQREMWIAAEKIKRDKWIQEKTKSIKDQTVKGLEPEIQRMIAQHKAQVRDLEEKYREQVSKEKAMLADQHQRQLDALRDRSVAERQKACEEEREFARQRYIKQLERDEMEFQQQKRKLIAEFDEQKHNMIESFKEERKMDDQTHRKAMDDLRGQIQADRDTKVQAIEELRKKHVEETQILREKLQIEKEEWQSHYMKKIENEVRTKEKQFKNKLVKERDAELQMVIQRLESENTSSTSDATRKYRMDIERIKAETAEEVKHLRDQHSMALDKVLSAQSTINQLEEHRRQLQKDALKTEHEMAAKDATIRQQKVELGRLKVDEQTLADMIRREFNEKIESKETAIQSLTDQITMLHEQTDVLRRRYQQELDTFTRDKEMNIAQIEDGVKHALKHKDDIISTLKTQHEQLAMRNGQLEALVDKQRQEFLM